MCNVICSLKVCTKFDIFDIFALYNYKMKVPKTSRMVYISKVLWIVSTPQIMINYSIPIRLIA